MRITEWQLRAIIKEQYWKIISEQEDSKDSSSKESSQQIVSKAIDNTPTDYMERSLAQRTPGPNAAGSTFKSSQSAESLKSADWKPLSHNAGAITSPAVAFEASIPGLLGAADITSYSDNEMPVVIQPAHGGKGIHRASGKLMAEIVGVLPGGQPDVNFTTIILGPMKEDPKKLQVYTFHPGAPAAQGTPIFLEDMKRKFKTESDKIKISLGEAKSLGFVTVKHVDSLPDAEQGSTSLSESASSHRWQRLAGILKG